LTIDRDDDQEFRLSAKAVHLCVDMQGLTERDLANSVDGNRASTRRCDHKAISRTNNIYEIYPAAATRGYAWNVAPLLRKMAAGRLENMSTPDRWSSCRLFQI
jgi:hypothetical protein